MKRSILFQRANPKIGRKKDYSLVCWIGLQKLEGLHIVPKVLLLYVESFHSGKGLYKANFNSEMIVGVIPKDQIIMHGITLQYLP